MAQPTVVIGPRSHEPLPPEVIDEFETLRVLLDLHTITAPQWRRIVVILTLATLEAGNSEAGVRAYAKLEPLWRLSLYYTGDEFPG